MVVVLANAPFTRDDKHFFKCSVDYVYNLITTTILLISEVCPLSSKTSCNGSDLELEEFFQDAHFQSY